MTTVVTTVVTENCLTKHAIFFLIYRCPMSATVFKKKSSFKDDDDNAAKVGAVLTGAKEQRSKNDDERALTIVTAIDGTFWAHEGSSRGIGTF